MCDRIPMVLDQVNQRARRNKADADEGQMDASFLPAALAFLVFADLGCDFSGSDQGEKGIDEP